MKRILLFAIICMSATVRLTFGQCLYTITSPLTVCDSSCQGLISVSFSGGQLPISVYLDDGINTQGPFTVTTAWQYGNLCPGTYTLTAIDAAGDTCTGSGPFTIVSIPGPDITPVITNATCTGCTDGTVTIYVTGGTPPYAYNWSTGNTTQSVTGLGVGTYSVWVVDANGCWASDTFQIGVGPVAGAYMISGQVYYDSNSNGALDVGEPGVGNIGINLTPGSVNAVSNNTGTYAYAVFPGTYDVTFTGAPGWSLTSAPTTYNTTVSTASVSNLDFGVYPDSSYGSAVTSLTSGFPRCNWNVPYYLNVHNNGFTFIDGSLTFTHDPLLTFVSSSVAPASQVGNVLTYTYTGLAPGQSLSITVTLTEPAGGLSISSTLASTGTDTLGYQFAHNPVLNQVVNCSYDPNDKQVFPEGFGVNHFVTMDTWLEYMIRFQNTGTDTAFKVVILDTLDTDLNLATFTLLGASHPVDVTMRPGNEVAFTFENILLPDSNINEPGSHGYVLYRILGNTSNPDPTIVNNTAYIYFDLNSPVQTNTTLTTLSDNFLFIPELNHEQLILYPNPSSKSITLKLVQNSGDEVSVRIFDLSGRTILEKHNLKAGEISLDVSKLAPGVYNVEVYSNNIAPIYNRFIRN